MAQFIGKLCGKAGPVTRLGSKRSGLTVEASGWNCGVRVECSVDDEGRDTFIVFKTGGSNNKRDVVVGTGEICEIKDYLEK